MGLERLRLKRFFAVALWIFVLWGCGSDEPKVDVSSVQIDLQVKRLDEAVFQTPTNQYAQKIPGWRNEYGRFFEIYTGNVLPLGGAESPALADNMKQFVEDQSVQEVYTLVQQKFPDLSPVNADLETAFKHYRYYFPEKPVPDIVYFVAPFNYAVLALDSELCIGLDMFLGADCEYYAAVGLNQYQIERMLPENVAVEAVKGWLTTEYTFDPSGKNLLETMLHHGRVMYILDRLMPEESKAKKFSYTDAQWEWCETNELQIWTHFVDQKLLFNKDRKEIQKYTGDGPFTSGFDKQSPSRTAVWMGYRIVQSYMKQYPETSFTQLMEIPNAQGFLNRSGYKPER